MDLLKSRAGVSSKPSKRQQEREEEKLLSQRTSDVIESSQGHVNLFEDLEKVFVVGYRCSWCQGAYEFAARNDHIHKGQEACR